jgi:cytochrome c-type biogenesis protein CcmH
MKFWFIISGICLLALIILLWPLKKTFKHSLKSSGSLILVLTLSVLIPLSAFLLYGHWGAYSQVQQAAFVQQRVAAVKADISQTGSRQHLITEFEEHLRDKPKNAKGWYLLGKLYLQDGRVKEATAALEKSNQRQPNQPETMLALAEALFRDNKNALSPHARILLLKVLKISPDATLALNLLAIDVYNKGQYNQAVSYFERLLPYYPPESEEGKRLLAVIAKAQQLSKGE